MKPKLFYYDRLVNSEDLNHHNTLFAGRCAEWFVEAGFIAVANELPATNIVCLKIHGLTFTKPLKSGSIASFQSQIVYVGRSSIKVFVQLIENSKSPPILDGFLTFVYIDDEGKAKPHGLLLELDNETDLALSQMAEKLR